MTIPLTDPFTYGLQTRLVNLPTEMKQRFATFIVPLLLFVTANGCHRDRQNVNWDRWLEYEKTKLSCQELAYYIKSVNSNSLDKIESFSQLTNRIKLRFQEVTVIPKGDNPFPNCLADHSYKWLNSWADFTSSTNVPLLWTPVELYGPKILYIDTKGEIGVENEDVFDRLISGFAGGGGTNISGSNSNPASKK
jgi:hypothetical protein